MKNLFSLENPLVQLLSRACDLMIVNLLFIISCIPVVTVGAAICGMMKVCQAIVTGDERGIWNLYWTGFKNSFKQATAVWLCVVVVAASLFCYWLLITNVFTGALATVMLVLMIILAVIASGLVVYLFPLITRYDNSLREHVKNAGILAITRLLLTPLLILFTAVPFVLPLISLEAFMKTMIFWIIFGFAFLCYLANLLLKPIYGILESPSVQKNNQESEEEAEAEEEEEENPEE